MAIIKKILHKMGIFFIWFIYIILALGCFFFPLSNPFHGVLEVLSNVGSFSFGISILSILFGSVVVTPRYDPMYKNAIISDEDIDSETFNLLMSSKRLVRLAVVRFILYANAIVFPKFASNKPGYKKWFKGDDLRSKARNIDKFFAYGSFYCFAMSILIMIIYYIIWGINQL